MSSRTGRCSAGSSQRAVRRRLFASAEIHSGIPGVVCDSGDRVQARRYRNAVRGSGAVYQRGPIVAAGRSSFVPHKVLHKLSGTERHTPPNKKAAGHIRRLERGFEAVAATTRCTGHNLRLAMTM